ncbi:serine/threonine protein kinase [Streptomyces sp. SID8359]|uniref:class III lanthionine synthetase LanKC n=1 Tax=unclassified Streptomyces TaxID=2593676 RepID=UPI00048D6DB1|nr:class III lanthionine synthetase LanKC [Streptomyces sp. SolWspMP-sol2th]MYT89997.1 serine/threonine protein kinase [Streptomyces sp. SID8359]
MSVSGIQQTQLYCLADPTYYETPARLRDEETRYPLDSAPPPEGLRRVRNGLWTSLLPEDREIAEQGWKIHISTVPEEAEATLRDTARICLAHGVPFKFLRSEQALLLMSDKYMARSGAGKFLTLYPPDETVFLRVLDELVPALTGRRGPYILSDLRIGDAPVYVRYGAFVARWCLDADGERVPALRHPSGELVPDERGVVFRVPPWVTVPEPLRPHLAARAAAGDTTFPYTVTESLQFSNAGGIYRARHRETGRQVVLREARPHSGLDAVGHDAVTRLHREYRALTALAGLDCVPEVHGVRSVWEHHFLIEEHIEGSTLLEEIVARFALLHGEGTDGELATYTAWVDSVTERLAQALAAIHARGFRFGDLHPTNVIIRPDGRLVLVDFEYATDLDDQDTPVAGAPGLQAPTGTPGAESDAYALWATWLYMLMPIMEMAGHDRAKAVTLERWARRRYRLAADAGPIRPAALRAAEDRLGGEGEIAALLDGPVPDWAELRTRLIAGIHAGATPERTDRLFPGDPQAFATGGGDLAHGAAGVLYALHRVGAPVDPAWTDWLSDAARRRDPAAPGGLYGGLPGTAVVLSQLGRADEGRELFERAAAAPPSASADLLNGRAGIALAALRLARPAGRGSTGPAAPADPDAKVDHDLVELALRTAHDLDRLVRGESVPGLAAPASAGLLRGLSGAALLHLELHALTGEDRHLRAAGRALEREAGHCVTMPGGTVQVKDGRRHLLYLDQGSGGVALVAQAYLARRAAPSLAALLPGVRRGCTLEFIREPGLFTGRAGLMATAGQLSPEGRLAPDVLASVRNLSWHLLAEEDRLLVPGARLRRCSADLATGAAGLLLALHFLSGGGTGAGAAGTGGTGAGTAGTARPETNGTPGLLELLTLG